MSIYTALCAGALFPLHERLRGHQTVGAMREYMRTQWLAPEKLVELQINRLRHLLVSARDHVPYYRELFQRIGFEPQKLDTLADLGHLPILNKSDIRGNSERMKADNAVGLRSYSTTGSSGDPMLFGLGKLRISHDVAAKWRATRWWNVDIGDREFVAWSSAIELSTQDRVRRLRDWIFRSKLASTAALTEPRLDELIAQIRAMRPRMLFGYPSTICLIAQRARERSVRMDDLGIAVAFVTAERLYPHQRDAISAVFGCPVANGYGGRDSGFLAHECPAGGLHITADEVLIEVVDPSGKSLPAGEEGEVVVTHLFSHDFPFVRYKNGDTAVLDDQQCPCGRGLPLIREIKGRTNDFLTGANGARVHDVAFAMVLRDMEGMEQFKIIQESLQNIRLLLVVNSRFVMDSARPRIERAFKHFLGDDVVLAIDLVPRIEPEATGKYRYVVSKI